MSEEVPLENSQPEILEAEDRESDAARPEFAVEDPEDREYPEEQSGEEEPASEEAPLSGFGSCQGRGRTKRWRSGERV